MSLKSKICVKEEEPPKEPTPKFSISPASIDTVIFQTGSVLKARVILSDKLEDFWRKIEQCMEQSMEKESGISLENANALHEKNYELYKPGNFKVLDEGTDVLQCYINNTPCRTLRCADKVKAYVNKVHTLIHAQAFMPKPPKKLNKLCYLRKKK